MALEAGHRESKESWASVLRQLKDSGLKHPRLLVGDGNLGLWAAVSEVYPQAQQQLCWNHKMLNVIDTVSRKEQSQVKRHLQAMMCAESREQALAERKKFEQAFRHTPKTIKTVVENWERLTHVLLLSPRALEHLRTSNVVESPFSRVAATNRCIEVKPARTRSDTERAKATEVKGFLDHHVMPCYGLSPVLGTKPQHFWDIFSA